LNLLADAHAPAYAPPPIRRADEALLRASVALVWIATAVTCVHPYYREIGAAYLARLGLGAWAMYASDAVEVALGVALLVTPMTRAIALAQVGAVAVFTVVLAVLEPILLVSPFGVLTKNVSFVLVVLAAARAARGLAGSARGELAERERAVVHRLVVAAATLPWLTEGLFPKLLFQQSIELSMAPALGLTFASPSALVAAIGVAQLLSGVLALTLRGAPLRALLYAHAAALVALPLVVGSVAPGLWVHPFGPFSKNLPVLAATIVRLRGLRP
jgi:hypothetical protein